MKSNLATKIAGLLLGTGMCVGLIIHSITQTPPQGSLDGVLLDWQGQPLDHEEIQLTRVGYEPGKPIGHNDPSPFLNLKTDKDGRFRITNAFAGSYHVYVSTKGHEYKGVVEVIEAKKSDVRLNATRKADYLEIYCTEHVVRPSKPAEFTVSGLTLEGDVVLEVYEFPFDKALNANSIYNLYAGAQGNSGTPPTMSRVLQRSKQALTTKDNEGAFTQNLKLDGLKPGLYWVRTSYPSNTLSQGTWLNITNIGLVAKSGPKDTAIVACDLTTGEPMAGVALYKGSASGAAVKIGSTNADGVFRDTQGTHMNGLLWAGRKGDEVAFVDPSEREKSDEVQYSIFFQSDRPVYRPGDEVQVKGTIRRPGPSGRDYATPNGGNVAITIRNTTGDIVKESQAPVSASGSFRYAFSTERWDEPGMYALEFSYLGSEETGYVAINEYRKPEYEVKVTPSKPTFFVGDKASVVVECVYYFGGPVQNADVQVDIYREPVWNFGDDGYAYGDYGDGESYDEYGEGYSSGGEYVDSLSLKTDSSGRAIVEFPTTKPGEDSEFTWDDVDIRYTVNASVSAANQYIDGKGSVDVIRSERKVEISSEQRIVQANEAFDVDLNSLNAVTGDVEANVPILVEAGFRVWDGNRVVEKPFGSMNVTSNGKGKSVVSIKPKKGGDLYVRAIVKDSKGRKSSASTDVWSNGEGSVNAWDPDDTEKLLEVETDMKSYLPGEPCKVLIQSSKSDALVYLSLEGDRLRKLMPVRLKNGAAVVEMTMPETQGRGLSVTAFHINKGRFIERGRPVMIDLGERKLDVVIRADKSDYLPGEIATYRIETTDIDGRPVPAEVSFGVVDESIYAIRSEQTNIRRHFYPSGYNEVSTSYSFESMYLDGGDKGGNSNIEIRRNFKDTAFWDPFVKTDSQGRAIVRVRLPDNLTTWRATAVGCSSRTDVGQSTHKIKVNKPLMARLTAPQYFVAGDEQDITLQVTNDTNRSASVHIDLSTTANVKFSGNAKRQVDIPAGSTENLTWTVQAMESGEAKFVARAWIEGGPSDGVERVVPVHPFGEIVRKAETVVVRNNSTFEVEKLAGADEASGYVVVTYMPNLYAMLFGPLDGLIDYPYGCVEQTMSRFIPLVVITRAAQDGIVPMPARANEINKMISQGFARLRELQRDNGSFGWWDYNNGDEGMTAYVLNGLAEGREAGMQIPESMSTRAVDFAKKRVAEFPNPVEGIAEGDRQDEYAVKDAILDRADLLLALARWGKIDDVRKALPRTGTVPNDVRYWAAMARIHSALGDTAKAQACVASIKVFGRTDVNTMGWDLDYGFEGTAQALRAMVAANPNDPDIEKVVQYLVLQKRGDGWMSTRDTSAILTSMLRYLTVKRLPIQPGGGQILVNGRVVASVDGNQALSQSSSYQKRIALKDLNPGKNQITVTSTGGTGFATLDSFQVIKGTTVRELSKMPGVKISRAYHMLDRTTMTNGLVEVLSNSVPITSAKSGQLVRVVISVTASEPHSFVMLEDFMPSNCRTVERTETDYDYSWSLPYDRMVVRDDRIAFFQTVLTVGSHQYSYVMRAEAPGDSAVPSTMISQMYNPDTFATTSSDRFEVKPK